VVTTINKRMMRPRALVLCSITCAMVLDPTICLSLCGPARPPVHS
jgi:hypothetical protein